MSSKGREKQMCKNETIEHRHRKRKYSDCSDRKDCIDRQIEYSRHRRKHDSSSNSLSSTSSYSGSDQSSSEFETKKRSKKRRREKKSKSKSLKKAKKHKKKKKKIKQKANEIQRHKDSKLSEKKDLKVKNSPMQLKTPLLPGPGQSLVGENAEPAPKKRSMAPMTKEQYEKQQSVVRRVYDPETGRHRLVKGDGEIIEEIVSQQRHHEINKTATKGDGAFFQAVLGFSDK